MQNKRIISDVIIKRTQPKPAPVLPSVETLLPEKEIVQPYSKSKFKPISSKAEARSVFKGLRVTGIVLFLAVFFATAVILITFKSSRVEVRMTPKSAELTVNRTFVLSRSGAAGAIEFGTLALSYPMSGSFASGEKKSTETKAEGTVVIFNKSSKDPQVLITSTRLESPDGKIYRIPSTVIIPGLKVENGKQIPGSKEVSVIADKAGTEYNIGLTDFTIPGFKGSPKFETVFARSKTDMSGGYVGNSQIVTKNAVEAAAAELISEANKNLKNIISKKLPAGSVLLPGSEEYFILSTEVNPKIGSPLPAGQKFEIKLNAEARGAMIKEADLAKAVAKNDLDPASLGGGDFRILNLGELDLKLSGYKYEGETMRADVKGKVKMEAAIDIENAKNILMKSGVDNGAGVLGLFSAISRAELKYHPFWAGFLPGKLLDPMSYSGHIDIQITSR